MEKLNDDLKSRITVHHLGHIAIRVQNMNRAKIFYESLGLSVTWDATDWAYLQLPNSNTGIALLSPEYKSAGPHFAFHFSTRKEIEMIHLQLIESGYPVGTIHDHRDGTTSFYLQDPEGNWLEMLCEPTDGIQTNLSSKISKN